MLPSHDLGLLYPRSTQTWLARRGRASMPVVPTSQVGVADSNQILIKGLTGFRAPFVGVSMERDRHGRKLYCSDQTGAFGSSRVKAGMPAHRLPGKSHSPDVTIAESPDKRAESNFWPRPQITSHRQLRHLPTLPTFCTHW